MSRLARTNEVMPREVPAMMPWEDFERMETIIDDLWRHRAPRFFGWDTTRTLRAPSLDVYQDGDEIVVEAEVPGVRKSDLEIEIANSLLTIRGHRDRALEVEDEQVYRSERTFGRFSRSIDLPQDVDTTQANAVLADGVLRVRLPVTEEARHKALRLKIK
jgi:HSP20 family protein